MTSTDTTFDAAEWVIIEDETFHAQNESDTRTRCGKALPLLMGPEEAARSWGTTPCGDCYQAGTAGPAAPATSLRSWMKLAHDETLAMAAPTSPSVAVDPT